MNTVKFIGAWGCLTAGLILAILGVYSGLVLPLLIASLCFSNAPTSPN